MLYKLQDLRLVDCGLTFFAFPGALNQKNQIGVGNTENESLESPPLRGQCQLENIELSMNNFRTLNPETIAIDCRVNNMFLTYIEIQTVEPETIAALQVRNLVIGCSRLSLPVIKNITLGVSKSTVIRMLDFQHAGITYIPVDLFQHLRNKSLDSLSLKGKFSSGREGALASKFNYDFK